MDFRHTVENLRTRYSRGELNVDWHDNQFCDCKQVWAVRMACVGDKEFCNNNTFEIDEEWAHFVSGESEMPTPIPDKIGLPLVVRHISPQPAWRTRGKEYYETCAPPTSTQVAPNQMSALSS